MSNNDIAEHFLPAYPNMTKGRMTAKVFALMSDKSGRPRKIADPVDDERIQSATSITEAAEQAKKQVDNTAQESADKIKLSHAVDEMMEMVPDSRKPVKYYIATGYPHRGRAKQLGDVIKAVGGEITCEWWLGDESEDIAELAEIGKREFKGIRDCDVLVCLMPGYQGTHTELGAAVILGKKVIVHDIDVSLAKPLVPCYYQDNVKWIYGSELQLVAELLKVTA